MTIVLNIAAAVIVNDDKKTLLVRKRNTEYYMQAGGKIEGDEAPKSALVRELNEELGLKISPNNCKPLGLFNAKAANEDNTIIKAHLFGIHRNGTFNANNEIESVIWVSPDTSTRGFFAPLTQDFALPLANKMIKGEIKLF